MEYFYIIALLANVNINDTNSDYYLEWNSKELTFESKEECVVFMLDYYPEKIADEILEESKDHDIVEIKEYVQCYMKNADTGKIVEDK